MVRQRALKRFLVHTLELLPRLLAAIHSGPASASPPPSVPDGHRSPERVRALPCIVTRHYAHPHHSFGEAIQRMAKQVQGSLPVVGLLSRIMTPTGGVGNDELVCACMLGVGGDTCHHCAPQSYPDFCRSLYEQGIEPLNIAMSDLEKAYGKVCVCGTSQCNVKLAIYRQRAACETCSTACGHAAMWASCRQQ